MVGNSVSVCSKYRSNEPCLLRFDVMPLDDVRLAFEPDYTTLHYHAFSSHAGPSMRLGCI